MKKLLALLLSALMLLSACAFAEEADVNHSYMLSDLCFISGTEALDLSDLSIELDLSGAEKTDAGRVHLNVNGEPVAEIGLALVDGLLAFHMDSETLGHRDYLLDPVVFLANYLDQGVELLTSVLQQLDTTAMAQSFVDMIGGLGEAPAAVEAPEPTPAPVEEVPTVTIDLSSLPSFSFKGDLAGALQACVSEPETVEMGGVEYGPTGKEIIIADGAYTSTEFTFDTETVCEILNMVYLDGEPSGWGDAVREAGIDFTLHGTFQMGQAEGLNEIISVNGSFDVDDTNLVVSVSSNKSYTEDGSVTAVFYGGSMGEQSFGLGFNLTQGTHEGEAFTPASIDMDGATVLTDMENAEAIDELISGLSTVGTDAQSALTNVLMDALMAGIDAAE